MGHGSVRVDSISGTPDFISASEVPLDLGALLSIFPMPSPSPCNPAALFPRSLLHYAPVPAHSPCHVSAFCTLEITSPPYARCMNCQILGIVSLLSMGSHGVDPGNHHDRPPCLIQNRPTSNNTVPVRRQTHQFLSRLSCFLDMHGKSKSGGHPNRLGRGVAGGGPRPGGIMKFQGPM